MTIMNVYKPPPTRLEQGSLPDAPAPAVYVRDFNSWHTDWGYKMAPSWQTGPPQLMQCSSMTRSSPTHSSPDAGILKKKNTWRTPSRIVIRLVSSSLTSLPPTILSGYADSILSFCRQQQTITWWSHCGNALQPQLHPPHQR